MKPYDIVGKVALVTGANRGIGKAITDSLIAHGVAKVYAAVRNVATAKPLVAEHGEKVVPLEFDLGKADVIDAAAKKARDVHVVINNAGVLRSATTLGDDALDALAYELDMNVFGLLRTARAFAPVLARNGGGAFVQLNSVASLKSFPGSATYCASKAAAYSLTQALRAELGAQGTVVISVHPGPIATQMADDAGFMEIAEPPSVVSEALVAALKSGTFHVFPDTMAKQIGGAYESFAASVVETDEGEES